MFLVLRALLINSTPRARIGKMRYQSVGAIGYGLQFVLYLVLAVVSALYLSSALTVFGANVSGFLTPLPGLLASIAWLYAGRERKSGLLTGTGVIGTILFFGSEGAVVFSSTYTPPVGVQPSSPQYIASILGIAALGLVIGILFVTFFVMETITFFSAGRIFSQRMFRFAGWGRVFGLIAGGALVIVASLYGFLNYLSSLTGGSGGGPSTLAFVQYSTPSDSFARLFSIATAGVYVILAIPLALAFEGFNQLRKEPENRTQQSQGVVATVLGKSTARYCPSCGNVVPIDSKHCLTCGSWFCPACGNAVSEGARFCSACGTMLL
jgi:predicted RNA-binding Zn-ribbon protein involved in translation (DUF1610 family)